MCIKRGKKEVSRQPDMDIRNACQTFLLLRKPNALGIISRYEGRQKKLVERERGRYGFLFHAEVVKVKPPDAEINRRNFAKEICYASAAM